jgi:hypothetical protein
MVREISGSHGGEYVAPCSPVEVYRCFRGACCLHHQAMSEPPATSVSTVRVTCVGATHSVRSFGSCCSDKAKIWRRTVMHEPFARPEVTQLSFYGLLLGLHTN